jgi:hypothetical protein
MKKAKDNSGDGKSKYGTKKVEKPHNIQEKKKEKSQTRVDMQNKNERAKNLKSRLL